MLDIDQTKYLVIDRKQLGQTIKRNLAPLKEKGLLGRPFKLTEIMVTDILEMLEQGIPYSKISQKHNISKTIVCRIKQKGVSLIDQIRKKNKDPVENQYAPTPLTPANNDAIKKNQLIVDINEYAEKLQRRLKNNHNIYLKLTDCLQTMIVVLNEDDEDTPIKNEVKYDYPNFHRNDYIELTSHTWPKQKPGYNTYKKHKKIR